MAFEPNKAALELKPLFNPFSHSQTVCREIAPCEGGGPYLRRFIISKGLELAPTKKDVTALRADIILLPANACVRPHS